MKLIWGALLAVLVYLAFIVWQIALGHEMLEVFANSSGTRCCRVDTSNGPPDCAVISEDVAMAAGIGSTVIVPLPTGDVPTVINAIHPSPTNKDYACVPGCLIRRTLY